MFCRIKFFAILACAFLSSLSFTEATTFAPIGPLSNTHVLVAECTDTCVSGFLVKKMSNVRSHDPMMRNDLFEIVNITYTYSISDIHTLSTTTKTTLDAFIQRNGDIKNGTFEFEVTGGHVENAQRIESAEQLPLQGAFQKWSEVVKQSNADVRRNTIYSLLITLVLYAPLLLLFKKRFSVYWSTIILIPFVILVLLFLIDQTLISQDTFFYGYTLPLIYLLVPIAGVLISFTYFVSIFLMFVRNKFRKS